MHYLGNGLLDYYLSMILEIIVAISIYISKNPYVFYHLLELLYP